MGKTLYRILILACFHPKDVIPHSKKGLRIRRLRFLKQTRDISLLNRPSGLTFPTKSQTHVNSITKLEQCAQRSFDNGSEWPENHPKYYQKNYLQNILEVTKCRHPVFPMFTSLSRSYMGQGVYWFRSTFSSILPTTPPPFF